MTISVIKRFFKGFIASGISSMLFQLQAGAMIHSASDLKQFGISLAVAFFTGVFMAVEKYINWTPAPEPVQS